MESTYLKQDVTLLLKDITGQVTPLPTEVREQYIQSGVHYCEMLPLEYKPSQKYMDAYFFSLKAYAKETALALCQAAENIYQHSEREITLVSLARAGIPIGILMKRYLEAKYQKPVFHYSISIIRDYGLDKNAMDYILSHHPASSIQFVDGWIGKGAITKELAAALAADYPLVSPALAVVSDPAYITGLCGTHEDILIPSSCLNCTVSGLLSRTFCRSDIIGAFDFHGAMVYWDLQKEDLSYDFIDKIEAYFDYSMTAKEMPLRSYNGLDEVTEIANRYNIDNINLIKPGIGEATRVLLRRVPWRLLVKPGYQQEPQLTHLIQLAQEKKVPVVEYDLKNYKACGIIKNLADA